MNKKDEESLANKAGFSFAYGLPHDYPVLFPAYLKHLSKTQKIRPAALQETVSERMLQYILAGRIPTKESAAALGILLELSPEEMQPFLGRAGYILSRSLPRDIIIMQVLQRTDITNTGRWRLFIINEILEECSLPLLMTRTKKPGDV